MSHHSSCSRRRTCPLSHSPSYAVQAAIPPCFFVTLVERPFAIEDLDELEGRWSDSESSEDIINEKLASMRLKKVSVLTVARVVSSPVLFFGALAAWWRSIVLKIVRGWTGKLGSINFFVLCLGRSKWAFCVGI